MSPKKFYVITGKGGVGKTTASLSLCLHLKNSGHNPYYAFFKSNTINDKKAVQEPNETLARELGIEILPLDLKESAKEYIGQKMHSQMIAKWVVATGFFRAIINMVPGFGYLILLGRILDFIKRSPENTVVVLDSPSTGHALTLLESTKNFQEIFQNGVLFDDAGRMLKILSKPEFFKIIILTLPSLMPVTEAIELKRDIEKSMPYHPDVVLNNAIAHMSFQNLPYFLSQKFEQEKEIIAQYKNDLSTTLPHSFSEQNLLIIKDLLPLMENLV